MTKTCVIEKCCFCGKPIPSIFDQNNPYPVHDSGNCCSGCNLSMVLPARIAGLKHQPLPSEDEMIETCTGNMGYALGDYHYWKSAKYDYWAGVEVAISQTAEGKPSGKGIFFAYNQASIIHVIRMFQIQKDSGETK